MIARGRILGSAPEGGKLLPLAAGLLALCAAPRPTLADILQLANGNILEGRVEILPDGGFRVYIEEGSSLTVPGASVKEHIPKEAPIDAFERRLESTAEDDRDALIELAAWGEEKGLRRTLVPAYRRILRLDPHHPVARDRLGWVLHRNRWVQRGDLERSGLVSVGGHWFTPEEAAEARRRAAAEEFRALLRDAHHENKYLREHALERLFALEDANLAPYLEELLAGEDPLDRLVAARVLGNLPFESGAATLFRALRTEPREEVRQGLIAVLRSYGDERLASWMARDFADAAGASQEATEEASDTIALRNLLEMAVVCPHRDCIPPLVDLLRSATWSDAVDLALRKIFPENDRGRVPWVDWWRSHGDELPPDLGSGWLRKRT